MVMNIPGIPHSECLQNVPLSTSDIFEYTPNILECYVLVDFGIRQEIWTKIEEAKNNPNVNTLVLYASIGNVALIADIPNFFSKH